MSNRSFAAPQYFHDFNRQRCFTSLEDTPNDYNMWTRARKKEDKHQAHLKETRTLARSTNSSGKRDAQQGIERPSKLQKTDRMSVGAEETAQESPGVVGVLKLGERSSVSRNLAEYTQKLGEYDKSRKRIQELKNELEKQELEHKASVNMPKHGHKIENTHNTALESLEVETGVKLQQIEQDYELQLERLRLERRDIKESAHEHEKKQEEAVQALRAENMSLKKQLEDEKSARNISTESLTSEINSLKEQIFDFSNREARGGASKYTSTPTPYLSSTDKTKEGNIRKVHARYKKRYDDLYGLGQDIVATL